MKEQKTEYAKKIGMPPGSLVYIGKQRTKKVSISKIDILNNLYEEIKLADISKYVKERKENSVSWINVNGIHDAAVIKSIGEQFNIDSLVLEDIMNANHRPKAEAFDNYFFITLKMLKLKKVEDELEVGQISIILGDDYLISFEESDEGMLDIIKEKVQFAKDKVGPKSEDYISFRIIDTIVDNYFLIIESIGEVIEKKEEELIKNPNNKLFEEIYNFKKKIAIIKKSVVPLRDAISTIINSDVNYISKPTQKYFKDVYEHIIHIVEESDSQNERLNDFLNMYMSGLSNKMNEIMQVLTIFASIFIPLTFIAGVYGMNFKYMPELETEYGYFITWGVMIGVVVSLLIYFRKKKWL